MIERRLIYSLVYIYILSKSMIFFVVRFYFIINQFYDLNKVSIDIQ